MLYRNPFAIPNDVSGEELVDVATDAFMTVAIARGGDLVEASVGFYDVMVLLHWNGISREMASDIMQAGFHSARERLRDAIPSDDVPMALSQMQALAGLLTSAFAGEGREEPV